MNDSALPPEHESDFPAGAYGVAELRLREIEAGAEFESINDSTRGGGKLAVADATNRLKTLIANYGDDAWPNTILIVAQARIRMAHLLSAFDEDEAALDLFISLHADFGDSPVPELREIGVDALRATAHVSQYLGRTARGYAILRQLIADYASDDYAGIQLTHASAQLDLVRWIDNEVTDSDGGPGLLRVVEAAADVRIHHWDSTDPFINWAVLTGLRYESDALIALSQLTNDDNDYLFRAQLLGDLAWDRFKDSDDPSVRTQLAFLLLARMEQFSKPSSVVDAASQLFDWLTSSLEMENDFPVVLALRTKGMALKETGDLQGALTVFTDLTFRYSEVDDPTVRGLAADAVLNRAMILRQLGRGTEALEQLSSTEEFLKQYPDDFGLRGIVASCLDFVTVIRADQALASVSTLSPDVTSVTPDEAKYRQSVDHFVALFADDGNPSTRTRVAQALFFLGDFQRDRNRSNLALATLNRLDGLYADDTGDIEYTLAQGRLVTGWILSGDPERKQEAIQVFDQMLARFGRNVTDQMREILGRAVAARQDLLAGLDREGSAGLPKNYESLDPAERTRLDELSAAAWERDSVGDHRGALGFLDEILVQYRDTTQPEAKRYLLDTLSRKANHLRQLGLLDLALATCDEAIARFGHELSSDIDRDLAYTFRLRASILDALGRHVDELLVYDEIIDRWDETSLDYLRRQVSGARFARAVTLEELGRSDLAENAHHDTIQRYLHDSRSGVAINALRSIYQLGEGYRKRGKYAEALAVYEDALQTWPNPSDSDLRGLMLLVRQAAAPTYQAVGNNPAAADTYRDLLSLHHDALQVAEVTKYKQALRQLTGKGIFRFFGGNRG